MPTKEKKKNLNESILQNGRCRYINKMAVTYLDANPPPGGNSILSDCKWHTTSLKFISSSAE